MDVQKGGKRQDEMTEKGCIRHRGRRHRLWAWEKEGGMDRVRCYRHARNREQEKEQVQCPRVRILWEGGGWDWEKNVGVGTGGY